MKEPIREIGTVIAGISEARTVPRNRKMIRITSTAEIISECSTSLIDALMNLDSSRSVRIDMPLGRLLCSSLISFCAPEDTVSVLAVDCL